jgi:hypothetical protein
LQNGAIGSGEPEEKSLKGNALKELKEALY